MFFYQIWLVVLVFISSKHNVVCLVEEDLTLDLRSQRQSPIMDSFSNFFTNLKSFFGVKSKEIEEKRQRAKSAFHVFFEEMNKKKELKKPEPILRFMEEPMWPGRGPLIPKLNNYSAYVSRKMFVVQPGMTAEQLITAHGYRAESHTVLTEDGYMLTMQRVLPDVEQVYRRVVLIHHGLMGSADEWLLLGRNRALPYVLTDNGFDVWLLNARGNKYSRIHTNKNPERIEFWDFTWHEMGLYDLPAVIHYVSEVTDRAELNFVGHSMGATALLVLLSTLPEYNLKLRSAILLAPLVFMYHAKGPIRVLKDFYNRNGLSSLSFIGQTEFLSDGSTFPEQMIEAFCKGDLKSCMNPLLLLTSGGIEVADENHLNNILSRVPAGGSSKTIIHLVQLVKSGYFQMYDYGLPNNLRKYGNSTPAYYDLGQVSLPLAVFSSPADWLATISDMNTLIPLLQDVSTHHVVKAGEFGHMDFIWSPDAPELVYNVMVDIFDKIQPRQDDFFVVDK